VRLRRGLAARWLAWLALPVAMSGSAPAAATLCIGPTDPCECKVDADCNSTVAVCRNDALCDSSNGKTGACGPPAAPIGCVVPGPSFQDGIYLLLLLAASGVWLSRARFLKRTPSPGA
jgi:hypothetical protein